MPKPKVIFVVGHSNWGKSETLRALTGGNWRVRRTKIADVEYFIRRMSNDDQPKSFIKRMTTIHPDIWPNIIAALCPDFDDSSKKTSAVLQALRDKGYRLFFWVLHEQYGTGELISPAEISSLRAFGKVELFSEVAEAGVRGKKLKAFIASTCEA
ncbi:MAG: hypothetical protein Q7T70_05285 [Polaromonas sp.]|nr:hypothetical protein [Polaromonas sp.]